MSIEDLLKKVLGEQPMDVGNSPHCPAECNNRPEHVQKFDDVLRWPLVLILFLKRNGYIRNPTGAWVEVKAK